MFTAAFFIMAPNWKQPKCTTSDWINKMSNIHTVKHYSAIKKNELHIYATTWMNLKNIILSGRNQSPKYMHVCVHMYTHVYFINGKYVCIYVYACVYVYIHMHILHEVQIRAIYRDRK